MEVLIINRMMVDIEKSKMVFIMKLVPKFIVFDVLAIYDSIMSLVFARFILAYCLKLCLKRNWCNKSNIL